ncbi:MAG: leucine-rich repeat protein [Clostridia bacterium]|nr:leucine-rich repeat protein [Clostridia bacterium]
MKRKSIIRIASSALVLLLLSAILLTGSLASFGGSTSSPSYFSEYLGNLKTNAESFFNKDVVHKLPSNVKDTDIISVIFSLDIPAIMDAYEEADASVSIGEFARGEEAKEIIDRVVAKRTEILKDLDQKGIKYTRGADYSTIITGFELLITAKDFESSCDVLGDRGTAIVGEVYEPSKAQLVENDVNFYEDTGIFNSSDFKYDGTGMVVAVLDTGLDYTHTAFSDGNFGADRNKLGLTKEMVASLLLTKDFFAEKFMSGVSVDDLYVSDKVPFAFDYADKDADVYSLHNNHGTHVSGVIAGKDSTITGVAPNAQIVSMKTFSDVEESARTSWILSALEDCVLLGVDVINMSLGTACGFSRESDKEAINGNVYQKIRDAGISLVVAASNSYNSAYSSDKNGNLGLTSNPDTATVGSPSTYDGAMSVASINGKKTPYILYNGQIIYFIEATDASSEEKDFFEELLSSRLPAGSQESIELDYVLVPGAGRPADYTGMDVKGKIVLVKRGSNTFEEKAQAAQDAGASAIIIYNNVSGDIKMNAGTISIPICSISQDDGELLASANEGKLTFSRAQTSGPFISDFSSWGPGSNLSIKPEITAHGGNILSAVTGGGYDRLSGTSMACPNMAGVIALLRQYVENEFEEIKNMPEGSEKANKTNALVNCLIMSTADVVRNKNGLPYAVRKQGAGLANLVSASTTTAYIQTYDREDGSVMDKSKIELGDDKDKTGVYTLKFAINNFGSANLTYELSAIVMSEGVSETETVRGETTVTEEGYMLDGAKFQIISVDGGSFDGNTVTVRGNKTAVLETRITLSAEDKAYLDSSFENGMYVEGFIKLDAKAGTEVDLSVPYLAFYGDWTRAPLFDTDYFETNKDELDDGISQDDKVMADAYATRPIGGLYSDYVSYLGSYYYQQNPQDKVIAASRDYIALSYADETVHSLRFVWAGILRNAQKIVITITDASTGEVIYQTVDYDVRKSYGDGGPIYPSNVEIEFDTQDYDLPNNAKLNVKLEGYVDYGDGGIDTNLKNTFEFPIVIDYEAPAITDCEFYTEYDKDLKKTRLFARMAVYDNHYAMALNLGYVAKATEEEKLEGYDSVLKSFDSYLTPVYSTFNGTTYVEYELTDYIFDIKENSAHKNTFVATCYDYALNTVTYEIGLPDEYVDFYFEESSNEVNYLSLNQVYQLKPIIYPNAETNPDSTSNPWAELIEFNSTNENAVKIVNDKLVAVGAGTSIIQARDLKSGNTASFKVRVIDDPADPNYKYYDKPVADVFDITGYETLKAFYYLSTDERDIGMTGDVKMYDSGFSLSMFPSESVQLIKSFVPYFDTVDVVYISNNTRIVEIDENGVVTAKAEGYSSVTVKLLLDGKSTFYSETISVEVKKPWIRTGPSLTHYFGLGGTVEVPASLNLKEIGAYAFSNFDYVEKGPEDEISEEAPDATKIQFLGEDTIKKVIIPNGVEKIAQYAFANLTALEEVVLPSTLEAIEYGAFLGCTSLKTVSYMDENGKITQGDGLKNVMLINKGAFQNCDLRGTISLNNARAVGDYAFAENRSLAGVVLPQTLKSIGAYAFAGDTRLSSVKIKADTVKYGPYVFSGCTSLTSMTTLGENGQAIATINTPVIPEGAFYNCKSLTSVIIGKSVNVIGEYAFAGSGVASFSVNEQNTAFSKLDSKSYILSADSTQLVLVAPTVEGSFTLDSRITSVGIGAFAENKNITSVSLTGVTSLGKYAFAECSNLHSVTLGALTEIGDYAFFGTAITSHPSLDSVDMIGKYAFAETDITAVTIPDGKVVGEGAFCECEKLSTVVIGDDVTLGMGAFSYNTRLNGRWQVQYYTLNGKRHYYYDYMSPIKSITIGKNAVIGDSAFMGASDIELITLGENAVIGKMAFYNTSSLKEIRDHNGLNVGLTTVKSVGESAFTGDEQYVYTDSETSNQMIKNDMYVYHYYASAFETLDLTGLKEIGKGAFAYCDDLVKVTLDPEMTKIAELAFYGCSKLSQINLENVKEIGANAFANTKALKSITLSGIEQIGDYAFAVSGLESVDFGDTCCVIGNGAFVDCTKLQTVTNTKNIKEIGNFAFANSIITGIDLTSVERIGNVAFMKKEEAPLELTLGDKLVYVGDNPFTFCQISIAREETVEFNGKEYKVPSYTYDISDSVKVVNGALYCKIPTGYELILYAGNSNGKFVVMDGTVRISSYAFAGSDIEAVELPLSLDTIGHKAFFGCEKLKTVVFKSYQAPILEEEIDIAYYMSYDNIPATGEFQFQNYDGSITSKEGLGIVPYFMWNVPSGLYYDVFFGANFIDHIGHIDSEITMVKPSNGKGYDTFILAQYFDKQITGELAMRDETLNAIEMINRIPKSITLADEALIISAREAYSKIATKDQQAMVSNYSELEAAERKLRNLKADSEPDAPITPPDVEEPREGSNAGYVVAIAILATVIVCGSAVVTVLALKQKGILFKRKADGEDVTEVAKDTEEAQGPNQDTTEENQ